MSEASPKPPESNSASSNNKAPCTQERDKNNEPPVNRLSPDILSCIMSIGMDSERRVWHWSSRHRSSGVPVSPLVASHVCSYWRNVAINSPILWTFIHIDKNTLGARNSLYLARTGPNALLDIFFDVRAVARLSGSSRWDVDASQQVSNILQFLEMNGAGAHRWRSLYAYCRGSDLLPIFVRFLNLSSPSSLEYLRYEGNGTMRTNLNIHNTPRAVPFTTSSGDVDWVDNDSYSLLRPSLPSLCDIELVSVPWPIFIKPTEPLPSLRNLSISLGEQDSSELLVENMLKSNPQLESLYLQTAFDGYNTYGDHYSAKVYVSQPVVMPALHSLYIRVGNRATWASRILPIIKAPALHRLTVMSNQQYIRSQERKNIVSRIAQSGYSSVQKLNISQFPCSKGEFFRLVTSLPLLNHLTIRRKQAEWLSATPHEVPNLESLTVLPWSVEEANEILVQCWQTGYLIRLAKFRTGYLKLTTPQNEVSTGETDYLHTYPQYEDHYYPEYTLEENESDWYTIRSRVGSLVDDSRARYEFDGYDSDTDSSECNLSLQLFD